MEQFTTDALEWLGRPLFMATPFSLILTGLAGVFVGRFVSGLWK
jgi:hypothetical protein